MSAAPSPKEVVVRWFEEVWNRRSRHIVCELMADNAVGHLEGGQDVVGCDGFFAFQDAILAAMPDIQVKILRVTGDGEDACLLWEATAVHSGHGMGFAPTNKKLLFRGTSWFRVVDGKMVEGWDSWNQAAVLAQMAS